MPNKRTIDLLTESYKDQMTARRKYEFKNKNGEKIVDLYFKPLTRDDRVRAQGAANTDDALTISTYLLCKNAELEDGTKAFAPADAPNAITRALEAARDLLNSSAAPVILPKG